MKFTLFTVICSIFALAVACTSDKGKNISPKVTTLTNTEICDTSATVSYSAQISLIIANNCISCHGPTEHVKLNDHANVQANALTTTGSIYGAISHDGIAMPMPPNRSLSACDIGKIKKWINLGAPNN